MCKINFFYENFQHTEAALLKSTLLKINFIESKFIEKKIKQLY